MINYLIKDSHLCCVSKYHRDRLGISLNFLFSPCLDSKPDPRPLGPHSSPRLKFNDFSLVSCMLLTLRASIFLRLSKAESESAIVQCQRTAMQFLRVRLLLGKPSCLPPLHDSIVMACAESLSDNQSEHQTCA